MNLVNQNCKLRQTAMPHPALRMGWQHLLFLHWPVEDSQLRARVPRDLEIDTFDSQAYIGLVPFTMTRVRPRPLPGLPFAPRFYENFHETNVRTYVRHRTTGERGVWFFSLDAASLPAVIGARHWFRLPYFWSKMNVCATRSPANRIIEYSSRRIWPATQNANCNIRIQLHNQATKIAAQNTLEHFLVERYTLFSGDDNALFRGLVRHRPYQLQNATIETLHENLIAAAGIEYSKALPHVLYSPEARVEAWPLQNAAFRCKSDFSLKSLSKN